MEQIGQLIINVVYVANRIFELNVVFGVLALNYFFFRDIKRMLPLLRR